MGGLNVEWEHFWPAFAASLPVMLAAFAAWVQSLRNHRIGLVAAIAAAKAADDAKAAHDIVNSQRAAMTAEIRDLKEEIVALKQTIADAAAKDP